MRSTLVLVSFVLGACSGTTCPDFGSSSGPLVSNFGATCSDGHRYEVACTRASEGTEFACACSVDDTATGRTFTAPASGIPSVDPDWHPAVAMVNPGCGWTLDR